MLGYVLRKFGLRLTDGGHGDWADHGTGLAALDSLLRLLQVELVLAAAACLEGGLGDLAAARFQVCHGALKILAELVLEEDFVELLQLAELEHGLELGGARGLLLAAS